MKPKIAIVMGSKNDWETLHIAGELLSEFGSTSCKALWRCLACAEPFEHFKPI